MEQHYDIERILDRNINNMPLSSDNIPLTSKTEDEKEKEDDKPNGKPTTMLQTGDNYDHGVLLFQGLMQQSLGSFLQIDDTAILRDGDGYVPGRLDEVYDLLREKCDVPSPHLIISVVGCKVIN